jgi:hypothetical protein
VMMCRLHASRRDCFARPARQGITCVQKASKSGFKLLALRVIEVRLVSVCRLFCDLPVSLQGTPR